MPLVHDEACRMNCTCLPDDEVILPDGRVNVGAFIAHAWCIRCQKLVDVYDFDESDIEMNGGDISVLWHGSCPGCGTMYNLEVTMTEADTPPEQTSEPVHEQTEAERAAKWNSRGRR